MIDNAIWYAGMMHLGGASNEQIEEYLREYVDFVPGTLAFTVREEARVSHVTVHLRLQGKIELVTIAGTVSV